MINLLLHFNNKNRSLVIFLFAIFFSCSSNKESTKPRLKLKINENWEFITDELTDEQALLNISENAKIISLPHTWNKNDLLDSVTYKRGKFQYNKKLNINRSFKNKKLFLHFEGVNQIADIYINSKFVQQHKGGYTAFTVEITDYIHYGNNKENILSVVVDNRFNKNIPPLSGDFNFYGGIYRNVWLIATNYVHFSLSDYGSKGIYISTPKVSETGATVKVEGLIENQSEDKKNIVVINTVTGKDGEEVCRFESELSVNAHDEVNFASTSETITNPQLWSPDKPNLYSVSTELFEDGKLIDRIDNPFGFRYYSFDAQKGVFLNGKHIKLMGSNRHQDFAKLGNSLPDSLHITDMEIAKKAGFNFIRLAHYPQSPVVLNKADELGLIVWEEIPVVNYVTTSQEFKENSELMLKEMIHQHFNHTSILFWGYMNEVFLNDSDGKRGEIMNFPDEYLKWTVAFAKRLDSLAHNIDPFRFTAIAIHQNHLYNETTMNNIPDVVGYNLYQGWYFGKAESFGRFIDNEHSNYPERRFILSEYGAGSDIRLHTKKPERFDFTIEFQQNYLENYFQMIMERPFIGAASIWAQNDFRSDARGDTRSKINQKGLLTLNREYKDIYFMYKANLNPEPMVYIASRNYKKRNGIFKFGNLQEKQFVKVYSNIKEVELFINGQSLGEKSMDSLNKAVWEVPFKNGANVLEVKAEKQGETYRDELEVDFSYRPAILKDSEIPFTSLRVNVGSNAEYVDSEDFTWLADQKYREGSFGYFSGKFVKLTKNRIKSFKDTPLYYSFNEGIKAYKIDVPDGEYELELHFIENENIKPGEREFSIIINNEAIINSFDIARSFGQSKAVIKRFPINIKDNQSLTIEFANNCGLPILSAIKLEKK
ncbi:MAG: hypothetical protein DRJ07_00025 [Bacteroidetes bacterium]|nr:MAG: hypothetical protein DRJ07_00025 [Bacteroidota bacterium]